MYLAICADKNCPNLQDIERLENVLKKLQAEYQKIKEENEKLKTCLLNLKRITEKGF